MHDLRFLESRRADFDTIAPNLLDTAYSYLGTPYTDKFRCLDFVKTVYNKHLQSLPPKSLNLTYEQVRRPPLGYVVYLASKKTGKYHVVIIYYDKCVIHCSSLFGGKVVVTELDEVLDYYYLFDEKDLVI